MFGIFHDVLYSFQLIRLGSWILILGFRWVVVSVFVRFRRLGRLVDASNARSANTDLGQQQVQVLTVLDPTINICFAEEHNLKCFEMVSSILNDSQHVFQHVLVWRGRVVPRCLDKY